MVLTKKAVRVMRPNTALNGLFFIGILLDPADISIKKTPLALFKHPN
jgi:hypothetical protein